MEPGHVRRHLDRRPQSDSIGKSPNIRFYVIGIADKDFTRTGKHPEAVFNPNDGWNATVCKYRCLRLPFASYKKGKFKFYCGWRERGNFGFKLAR